MNICETYFENKYAKECIKEKLIRLCEGKDWVNFIFVGTDSNLGDSLGPLSGTMISSTDPSVMIYGSLDCTLTAKDVPFLSSYLKKAHPFGFDIVIDAALGKTEDVGTIKICDAGIKPGLGVNKDLPMIGDASIIGVVGERQFCGGAMPSITRLSMIYNMAKTISDGINSFLDFRLKFGLCGLKGEYSVVV